MKVGGSSGTAAFGPSCSQATRTTKFHHPPPQLSGGGRRRQATCAGQRAMSLWRDNTGSTLISVGSDQIWPRKRSQEVALWATTEIRRHEKQRHFFPSGSLKHRVTRAGFHRNRLENDAKVHERPTRTPQWQAGAGRQAGGRCIAPARRRRRLRMATTGVGKHRLPRRA